MTQAPLASLASAQDALGEQARRRLLEDSRGELLMRIRRFFSLDGAR